MMHHATSAWLCGHRICAGGTQQAATAQDLLLECHMQVRLDRDRATFVLAGTATWQQDHCRDVPSQHITTVKGVNERSQITSDCISSVGSQLPEDASSAQMSALPSCPALASVDFGRPKEGAQATSLTQSMWPIRACPSAAHWL